MGFQVECVHGEAGEEFGIEVGGFLGHDFSAAGDIADLAGARGAEEERALRSARGDGVQGFAGIAVITDTGFVLDRLGRDAEDTFDDEGMQDGNIELAPGIGTLGRGGAHGISIAQAQGPVGAAVVPADAHLIGGCVDSRQQSIEIGSGSDIKRGSERAAHGSRIVAVQTEHTAVRRQDDERRIDVDEHREGELREGVVRVFVGVVERGFVAVMAVSDEELAGLEGTAEGLDAAGGSDAPELIFDVEIIVHAGERRFVHGLVKDALSAAIIFVEKENELAVHAHGAQEGKTIGFRFGESFFVWENNAALVGFDVAEADEAAADVMLAKDVEGLAVGVKRRGGILNEDALLNPLAALGGGPGIFVHAMLVGDGLVWERQVDEVIGAAGSVVSAQRGRNFVIRLCENSSEIEVWRIAHGVKRSDVSHSFYWVG